MLQDPLQGLGVDVDDHHFFVFPGQPFGKMITHLTSANHDDFHSGSPTALRWFIAVRTTELKFCQHHTRVEG
jgi:hypothetical protein